MANVACASHILVKDKTLADQLITRIQQGDDFARLARQHSTCASAKKGGDLGEFRKVEMVAGFDRAVFAKGSEDKKVVGPVKTKFGYHVIQVLYKS